MFSKVKLSAHNIPVLILIIGLLASTFSTAAPSPLKASGNATILDPPAFETLELIQSLDTSTWEVVLGDLASGFEMTLCPTETFYFLDVQNVTTNNPLIYDYFGFFLDVNQLPDGFYDYWAARGVVEGAPDWQGHMWEIINGREPMFYLRVWDDGGTPAYTLVDGLMLDHYGQETYLRVSGDYPEGAYAFDGTIEDTLGGLGDVTVGITFSRDYPEITDIELVYSLDTVGWSLVSGDLASGFELELCPTEAFYYLDTADVTVTHALSEGLHGFFLDVNQLPDGFYDYWAARGVVDGASDWQGHMWEIINGREPMFYLQVWDDGGTPAYTLVDGLMWDHFGQETYLRVSGDYPEGTYAFNGTITDPCTNQSQMQVGITFRRDYPEITDLELVYSLDTVDWSPAFGDLAGGFVMGLDPLVADYYLDTAGVTVTHALSEGLYGFFLEVNQLPDGFYDYWAARGVVEGAPDWQGHMWEIINGREPMFYLRVWDDDGTPAYMLVDGLMWDYFGQQVYLRVNGDYPLGTYSFDGTITDLCTNETEMQVTITFVADAPAILIAPATMEEVLYLGETATQTLNIGNAGVQPLSWEIQEVNQETAPPLSIPRFTGELPPDDTPVSFLPAPRTGRGSSNESPAPDSIMLNGSPAFGVNIGDVSLYHWPDLDEPGTWGLVNALAAGSYFCGDLAGSDLGTLYVIDNGSQILYAVDTQTGGQTEIGPSPALPGQTWTGMAWDPATGTMYGSATDGANATLFAIDLGTGETTEVAAIADYPFTIDIAVDVSGQMYGVDIGPDMLIRIDKNTGKTTEVGALGFAANYAQDLDFDDDTGILYWAACGDDISGELRVIDTTTGASAPVGAFPGGAEIDAFAVAATGAEVPWLLETPVRGTVLPVDGGTSEIRFDSGVVPEPGTYLASLDISSNDPDNSAVTVQVTMTVLAGADLGKLEGTVQGLGYCDTDPTPLEASVLIESGAGTSWLVDSDPVTGHYYRWLVSGTYTVTASAPDHQPDEAIVMVTGEQTTTQDMDLRWSESCMSWAPQALTVTLPLGEQQVETLAIDNAGAGALAWAFEEMAAPWVSVVPTDGVTAPDDSSDVEIIFDSTGLDWNQCYDADQGLLHDDPGWASPVLIPLRLCVGDCIEVTGVNLSVFTPDPIYAGILVQFRANIVPDEAIKPYEYRIDFGDGTPPVTGTSSLDPLPPIHAFPAPDTYAVQIEVWNCEMTVPISDSVDVTVVEGDPHQYYYLPLIVKNN